MRRSLLGAVSVALSVLGCGIPTQAQSRAQPPQPTAVRAAESGPANAPGTQASTGAQASARRGGQASGSITGTVIDPSGAAVADARVTLTRENQSRKQEARTGDDGHFSFADIAAGPFKLEISSAGFATQTISGILHSGGTYTLPTITLVIATAVTEVKVEPPRRELAEIQIKDEEKQRVFAFIPNFYISYVHDAIPLSPKQKFELAWKTASDPFTFAIVGAAAGLEQAANQYGGYGQGAPGYAKRYGAAYGDFLTSTFIGSAILPSLLKQDPRYFYKGTGSKRSRILYAVANAVICKGDNGRWQPNYSSILGGLASGGISNLYYPANDRSGAGLVFETAAIGIAEAGAINILQEFIVRKLTSRRPGGNQSSLP